MPELPPPAIAILPYGHSLGRHLAHTATEELLWPLGRPTRLNGKHVCDLLPSDHLIVYPKTSTHVRLSFGTPAQVSIMVVEPEVIHAKHLRMLRYTYRRFFRVLGYNEKLLSNIPNGIFLPYGTTWVPGWRMLTPHKSKMVSLIASNKRSQAGHMLRHRVVDMVQSGGYDVEVLGRGYKPFDEKSDGLLPYRYSVIIENTREQNYFTEKLIDAVLCDTVPIYWGCPNLSRFMDTSGMIICNTADDIENAMQSVSESDYQRRLPALRAIKEVADVLGNLEKRAALALRDSL